MIRVAINGYGRIGRNILRALYERPALREALQIVAINDLGAIDILAHLTRFDTVHGRFALPVAVDAEHLLIDGDAIRVLSQRDPGQLPWRELGIDVVFECTGHFTDATQLAAHLRAGARKVLLSAPGQGMDATVVYGVNQQILKPGFALVSNGSCTTNCLGPVLQPLQHMLGIESGFMTTVHAYTNDQRLNDVYHSDVYRARAATQSLIPAKTGAAAAIGLVLPELAGKLDGMAVRAPVINVSLVDLTLVVGRTTSVEEVNEILRRAAAEDALGVLGYCDSPLVSVDFNHCAYSSVFDASHTRVNGSLVKVMAWYDNEWGFSNRMLDTALSWIRATDRFAVA